MSKQLEIGAIYLMDRESEKRVWDGLGNRPFKVLQKINGYYLCESLSFPSLFGMSYKYKQCFYPSAALKKFETEHEAINWCIAHPVNKRLDDEELIAM